MLQSAGRFPDAAAEELPDLLRWADCLFAMAISSILLADSTFSAAGRL